MIDILSLLQASIVFGTVILYGALGEIITEKSGNLNLGVPGIMYLGGIAGLASAFGYELSTPTPNPAVCLALSFVCAFLAAAAVGLLYSFLTITLRANQNVTGLALTIFGTGFGNFVGELMNNQAGGFASVGTGTKAVFTGNTALTGLAKLFFSYNYLVYVGVALAVALMWFLGRSRTGLNLRSVGENPGTADAAGISVTAYQYAATCLGGGICGLGGMYIVMAQFNGVWQHNCISGKGWIAVALVIFATWSPARALVGSLVFGALSILRFYVPFGGTAFGPIYDTVPYIATVLVLIAVSIRQKRESQPPAHLGVAYFREER